MLDINKIYNMDCIEGMKQIDDDSIDLIITSPPYEDISGAGYTAINKDILFFKLYSEFISKLFEEYYRILKPTGQIFFNIKSKTHNKELSTPHWIEFIDTVKKFKLKSYIIWKYAGSFDSTNKRFHLDYEIIYHFSKTDDIFLNENCGLDDALTSVWYIPHNIPKADRIHPTQMPEKVVERILKICSQKGDVVLDNFIGSGTTAVVSRRFNCNYVGFEIKKEYCDIANKRLKNVPVRLETFINQDQQKILQNEVAIE